MNCEVEEVRALYWEATSPQRSLQAATKKTTAKKAAGRKPRSA
ncbi:hypothetical protein [Streptomyces sp. 061-3]